MIEARPGAVRPLTMTEAAIPVVALILLVAISFALFGDAGAMGPNQVALVMAAMVALVIGRRAGHTAEALREAAVASVGTGVSAIFILFALGALAGALLAVVMSPERVIAFADAPELPALIGLLKGAWLAIASGYTSTTGHAAIDALASRGGMESMLNTVWLIIAALAFGGVVEKAGVIERLMAPVIERVKSGGALVASLIGSTVATNVVTADQYIAIVLPGRMFKSSFEKRGLAPVVMSRSLGDSATVTSALIPWNSCGAYMAATLGVATLAYAPFTFFNFLSPLVSIVYAFLGIRMLKK